MKVQKHAISLACLAVLGAGGAQAMQVAGEALSINTNFYPQYQVTSFGDGSGAANNTLLSKTVTPAGNVSTAGKQSLTQLNWVNSYIEFAGSKAFGDNRLGYVMQANVMGSGTNSVDPTVFSSARDAFVYMSNNKLGTLSAGQMDTIFKEWGDRVRMLGVSSSNFNANSQLGVAPGWKPNTASASSNGDLFGVSTFNTRVNGSLKWVSPNFSGVEVGLTHRPDAKQSGSLKEQSIQGAAVRWSNPTYYVSLGTEIHNNFMAYSGNTATGTGIVNSAVNTTSANASSRDTAVRLSFGYTTEKLRVGADVTQLRYTEESGLNNKFSEYKTTTFTTTAEYKLDANWTVAAGYQMGAAGTCSLSGGADCSTDGLGGSAVNVGARYDFDRSVGIFALAGVINNNSNSAFGTGANTGGKVSNVAVGIHFRY